MRLTIVSAVGDGLAPLLSMELSIVIPAYKEASKIRRDVQAAADFLVQAGIQGEIIVVDDGSDDDTAAQAQAAPIPSGVQRQVIRYQPNRGKGYAVRTGVLASSGKIVMFADSGLCVSFQYILWGMDLIHSGHCEIAHGSRKLHHSDIKLSQNFYRRMGSKFFHALMRLFGVPAEISDSQCGFKIYRGDVARELYQLCISEGFMFDVEILLRAIRRGYRVIEFPIRWHNDRDSRLHPIRMAARIFYELMIIRQALASDSAPRLKR